MKILAARLVPQCNSSNFNSLYYIMTFEMMQIIQNCHNQIQQTNSFQMSYNLSK